MNNQIFYGKSADGSDAKEFEGVFMNPANPNEWSTRPYEKGFVCKGKHRYLEVITGNFAEWVCMCGRKSTD